MTRTDLYEKDARAVRRAAMRVVTQVGHYERNGQGDEIRFLLIEIEASLLLAIARRARRRYERERNDAS